MKCSTLRAVYLISAGAALPMDKRTPQSSSTPVLSPKTETQTKGSSRRQFIGRVGMAAAAAGVVGGIPKAVAGTVVGSGENGLSASGYQNRVNRAYNLRVNRAVADKNLVMPPHTTNGDEKRYPDKSASYSKGLLQDDIGVVNPAAWLRSRKH